MLPGVLSTVIASPEAASLQNMTLEQLARSLLHIRASYYTILAGFVIYCYDIFLTLDEETTLLKGGGPVKILYLMNRYLPFFPLLFILNANNPLRKTAMSDELCKGTFILAQVSQALEVVVATSIFVVRIHTIYHGHIIAQRILIFVLVASHVTLFAFTVHSCVTIAKTMFYSSIIHFCVGSPSSLTAALYLTPILVESFIVFMTLLHAINFGRRRKVVGRTVAGTILRTMYLDGSLYYLIVCGLRISTALVYYLAPETLILLMPYLEYALTSAVTSRWFLSFRRVLVDAFTPQDQIGASNPFPGPTITFGQHYGGSRQDGRRRVDKQETFISTHCPITMQGLQQDEHLTEIGHNDSMGQELRILDTRLHLQSWNRDV